jgi:hypothetical protein
MNRGPRSRGPASPTRGVGSHRSREPAPALSRPALDTTPSAGTQGRLPAKSLRMDGYSRFAGWRRERS